jgi:hypothetical protein
MIPLESERALLASLGARPAKEIDGHLLAAALLSVVEHYFETRQGISMRGVAGGPDWLGCESATWQLSEKIRFFLKERRDLGKTGALMDAIETIIADRRYQKGRQNFVLIMGAYGSDRYVETLKELIDDPDVVGHVVNALIKLKVAGCDEAMTHIAQASEYAWIRTAAKTYLKRLGRTS